MSARTCSWLTAREAAQHLGTTIEAIWTLASRRQWPRRRIGRQVAYPARAVALEVIRRAERSTQTAAR